ncbi:MAG: hypothetical protein P8I94_09510 [Emcibacteraceae bacterium]|nr:hypothetical protein [Emcibacteraceae bacterium]
MSYGIEIENTAGKTQINQDYTNYYLVANVNFAVTANTATYNDALYNIVISNYTAEADDICCINTGSVYITGYVTSQRRVGGTTSSGVKGIIWASVSGIVEVKIYRRFDRITKSTSGYGLEVLKADGNTLAFSSNYSYMNITGVLTGVPPFYTQFTPSDGSKPFISANTGFVKAYEEAEDGQYPGETEFQTVAATNTLASAEVEVMQGGVFDYNNPGTVQMIIVK